LLERLAGRCRDEHLGRLEWSVLDWNEPSIGFYRSLGAEPVEGWTGYRLAGDPLMNLGRIA
jgi:RimJ/RimL family protein N-acetyltransferase